MRKKFVGWALAHRDSMVGQSPTLQRHVDQTKGRRRRVRSGRLPGSSLAAFAIFLLVMFFVFIFVLWPICGRLIGKLIHAPDRGNIQRAQHKSIDTALELHRAEFDGYPPSDALDENGKPYCGEMKLCEAVMGRDLMGFHPDSVFHSDGTDSKGNMLYPNSNAVSEEAYRDSLEARKGPYLPLENANAYTLADIYGEGNTGAFDPNHFVLCDVFRHFKLQGNRKKVGMPILYYKADTSKTAHDVNDPNNPENIYNYKDNHELLVLGVPGKPGQKHPLYEDPKIFYEIAKNDKVAGPGVPYRADTFILLSAGYDGLYGTHDDIPNFAMQWKPK